MTDETRPDPPPDAAGAGEQHRPRRRPPGRPWAPGQSGNPAGRRPGSRNRAMVALDRIAEDAAEEVLRGVIEGARRGDARCAETILRRAWPERRGRPVPVPLPDLRTPGDTAAAVAAIVKAVSEGTLSPEEGQMIAATVELHRRAVDVADIAARLEALEARSGGGG